MGIFQNNLLAGAGGQASGAAAFYDHQIEQSARFDGLTPSYLELAASDTSGNRNYWTYSVWLKRSSVNLSLDHYSSGIGGTNVFLGAYSGTGYSDDILRIQFSHKDYPSTGTGDRIQVNSNETNMGFDNDGGARIRDPNAWYHVVWSNSNGTCIIYVNGRQWTNFSLDGGTNSAINSKRMRIGTDPGTNTSYTTYFGYMAEIMMISASGSAGVLTPSSFAETKNGVWVPKDISGLSNQDFYLKFENASDLGNDSSGNNRDWTVSGMGADHQVLDSPTFGS